METGVIILATGALSIGYVSEFGVAGISLAFGAGGTGGVLDCNDAGRTTSLPASTGTLRHSRRSITHDGVTIFSCSSKQCACGDNVAQSAGR